MRRGDRGQGRGGGCGERETADNREKQRAQRQLSWSDDGDDWETAGQRGEIMNNGNKRKI